MHITHLRTHHNDAVDDTEDCRKKYVARYLFLNIARTFSTEYNNGPFPLYCNDFRPTNVIVNSDLDTCGVIDWEYCYAAPAEFTHCSPRWLLLTHPDDWADGDLGIFFETYLLRCELFLDALRGEEAEVVQRGQLSDSQRLSTKMKNSLENSHLWFCLAAASSFGFDDIVWKFIHPFFFGEFTTIGDRICHLTLEQQDELDAFVELKMRQAENSDLDDHIGSHAMFTA